MPSQAELDKESGRSSLRSETMVGSGGKREERVFSGGARLNQGSTEWGGEAKGAIFDVGTNTYTPESDNQQGLDEDTNNRGKDDYDRPPTQDAVGLPLYPGDAPVDPRGILIHDDDTNSALWATESSLEDVGNADVSILVFESQKLSKLDGYAATEGIICQNGLPVDVTILINFT